MLVRETVFAVVIVVAGCGATYHRPDWTRVPRSSGLDPKSRLADLTRSQLAALCAWKIEVLGGYGKRYVCNQTKAVTTYTRSQCRQLSAPTSDRCSATVGDDERCVIAISADPCEKDWGRTVECGRVIRNCWAPRR
jgi:hypothetical protein